jgi:hypothetical protein
MPITSSGGRLSIQITLETNAEGQVRILTSKLEEVIATTNRTKAAFQGLNALPRDALGTVAGNLNQVSQSAAQAANKMSIFGAQMKQQLSGLASGGAADIAKSRFDAVSASMNSLETRFRSFGNVLHNNALSFGIAASSVFGLINAFDNMRRLELSNERIQVQAARLRNTATRAEQSYTAALNAGKLSADQAATGAEKIRVMRDRANVSTKNSQFVEEELKKAYIGLATQTLPLVVTAFAGVVQILDTFHVRLSTIKNAVSSLVGVGAKIRDAISAASGLGGAAAQAGASVISKGAIALETSEIMKNSAAKTANTGITGINAGAKLGNTGSTGANTIATGVNSGATAINSTSVTFNSIVKGINTLATRVLGAAHMFLAGTLNLAAAGFMRLTAAMMANPVGLVVAAVVTALAVLPMVFQSTAKSSEDMLGDVSSAWKGIGSVITNGMTDAKQAVDAFLAESGNVADTSAQLAKSFADSFGPGFGESMVKSLKAVSKVDPLKLMLGVTKPENQEFIKKWADGNAEAMKMAFDVVMNSKGVGKKSEAMRSMLDDIKKPLFQWTVDTKQFLDENAPQIAVKMQDLRDIMNFDNKTISVAGMDDLLARIRAKTIEITKALAEELPHILEKQKALAAAASGVGIKTGVGFTPIAGKQKDEIGDSEVSLERLMKVMKASEAEEQRNVKVLQGWAAELGGVLPAAFEQSSKNLLKFIDNLILLKANRIKASDLFEGLDKNTMATGIENMLSITIDANTEVNNLTKSMEDAKIKEAALLEAGELKWNLKIPPEFEQTFENLQKMKDNIMKGAKGDDIFKGLKEDSNAAFDAVKVGTKKATDTFKEFKEGIESGNVSEKLLVDNLTRMAKGFGQDLPDGIRITSANLIQLIKNLDDIKHQRLDPKELLKGVELTPAKVEKNAKFDKMMEDAKNLTAELSKQKRAVDELNHAYFNPAIALSAEQTTQYAAIVGPTIDKIREEAQTLRNTQAAYAALSPAVIDETVANLDLKESLIGINDVSDQTVQGLLRMEDAHIAGRQAAHDLSDATKLQVISEQAESEELDILNPNYTTYGGLLEDTIALKRLELQMDRGSVEAKQQVTQQIIAQEQATDGALKKQAELSQEVVKLALDANMSAASVQALNNEIKNTGALTDSTIISVSNATAALNTMALATNNVGLSMAQMAVAAAQGAAAAVNALQAAASQAISTNAQIAGMTQALTAGGLNLGKIQKSLGKDFLGVGDLSVIARAAHGDKEAIAQLTGEIQSNNNAKAKSAAQDKKNSAAKIDEKAIREQAVQTALKEVSAYSALIVKSIQETASIHDQAIALGVGVSAMKKFNKATDEFGIASDKARIALLKETLAAAENLKVLRSLTQATKDSLQAKIDGAMAAKDFEKQTRMDSIALIEEKKQLLLITKELGISLPKSIEPSVDNLHLLIEAAYGSADALKQLQEEATKSSKLAEFFGKEIDDAKSAIKEGHFSDFVKRELLFFQGANEFTGKIQLKVESQVQLDDIGEQLKKQLALINMSPDLFNKTMNDTDLKAGVTRTLASIKQAIGNDTELQAQWKPITDALTAVLAAPDTSEAIVAFAKQFPDLLEPALTGVNLTMQGLDTTIDNTSNKMKDDGKSSAKELSTAIKDVDSHADKVEKSLLKAAKATQSAANAMHGAGQSFKDAGKELAKLLAKFREFEEMQKGLKGIFGDTSSVGFPTPTGQAPIPGGSKTNPPGQRLQVGAGGAGSVGLTGGNIPGGVKLGAGGSGGSGGLKIGGAGAGGAGLTNATPIIKSGGGGGAGVFQPIVAGAQAAVVAVQKAMADITTAVTTAFNGLPAAVTPAFVQLGQGFIGLSTQVQTSWTPMLSAAVATAFNALPAAVVPAFVKLGEGFIGLSTQVQSSWTPMLVAAVSAAFLAAANGTQPSFVLMGVKFEVLTQWITKTFNPKLVAAVKAGFVAMVNGTQPSFVALGVKFETFIQWIKSTFNPKLLAAVKTGFDGMDNAAKQGFDDLNTMFANLVSQASTAVKKINSTISSDLKTDYSIKVTVTADDPNNLLNRSGSGDFGNFVQPNDSTMNMSGDIKTPIFLGNMNNKCDCEGKIKQLLLKLDIPLTLNGRELGRVIREHAINLIDNEL